MTILQLAFTASVLLALAAPVALSEDRLAGPGMAESSSPSDHEATSGQLDDHHATSGQIDDRLAGSENPDDLEAGSENPDDLEAGSEQLADHEGDSTALQNLPDSDQQEAEVRAQTLRELRAQDGSEQLAEEATESAPIPTGNGMDAQIAAVHAAKQQLKEARQAAAEADSTYGTMMDRDYPRGEARLKIVEARKLAHQALDAAEQRYDAALQGAGSPASN